MARVTASSPPGLAEGDRRALDIRLRGYAVVRNRAEQFVAEHASIGDIVDCARETGVGFAFPTRTVHVVEQEASTLAGSDA